MATIYKPTTGEDPLAELPQYGGAGGSAQVMKFSAGQKFKELFGRNPTASELSLLAPYYNGNDPNIVNTAGGDAAVAQYYQQISNSPENLAKRQQEQYAGEAGQYGDTIDQLFQSNIGRAATSEEKAHFGSLMASGQYDAYTLGQSLQQLPESVRKQDEEFRKSLSADLQSQGERYFSEKLLPSIQSQFARQGRNVDSSSYAAALAQAGQQQNLDRESFLRDLTANQYAGSQAGARQDYQNYLNRYYQTQDYATQRTDSLSDASRQRLYDVLDYQQQAKDYENYLKRYGKKSTFPSGAAGSLLGTGLGALLAAPTGGMSVLAGGLLGGSLGGSAGSLFGGGQ